MQQVKSKERRQLRKAFIVVLQFLDHTAATTNSPYRSTYICNALTTACQLGEITFEQWDLAMAIIQSRLGKYKTVGCWLVGELKLDHGWSMSAEGQEEIQKFRVRWIESLIKEFRN